MRAREIYKIIFERLSNISREAESETYIIMDKLFGIKKIDLLKGAEISVYDEEKLNSVLIRREAREPVQYIFNEQYFRNYCFYVKPGVLIPRPETELLVEKVIELIKQYFIHGEKPVIADIGCGSGAIAISLSIEISESVVYATDISEGAIHVTSINKENLKIPDERLIILKGNKLELFKNKGIIFDFIVSNPPYIPLEDYLKLEPEILNYEPEISLLGAENDGLGFYRYFAKESINFLKPGGFLCLEAGYGQAQSVIDILKCNKNYFDINILKDYNKIERVVTARLNYENSTG